MLISNCPFTIQNNTLTSELHTLNFSWDLSLNSTNLTSQQVELMLSVMNIALFNKTGFSWNYAENLNDGKGITFGIAKFASGTFDGRRVIEKINKTAILNGIDHVLARYYPVFQNIDNTEHDIYGNTSFVEGLENFIQDFKTHGNDDISKQAQLDTLNDLYWKPAIQKARNLTTNFSSTIAVFFDICANQGCDGDGYNNFGLTQFVNLTNFALKTDLSNGYNERVWTRMLSVVRNESMVTEAERWNSSYERAEIFRRLGDSNNVNLTTPLQISCEDLESTGEQIKGTILMYVTIFILCILYLN